MVTSDYSGRIPVAAVGAAADTAVVVDTEVAADKKVDLLVADTLAERLAVEVVAHTVAGSLLVVVQEPAVAVVIRVIEYSIL